MRYTLNVLPRKRVVPKTRGFAILVSRKSRRPWPKQLKKTQLAHLQLTKENAELRGTVHSLEGRIRNLEQHSRRQNIEIDGIPDTPGESVEQIVQDVVNHLALGLHSLTFP